jgi:hypothetical protein
MGRWISRDPIQEKGGKNCYKYARNNSLNMIDPDGRTAQSSTQGQSSSGPVGPNDPPETGVTLIESGIKVVGQRATRKYEIGLIEVYCKGNKLGEIHINMGLDTSLTQNSTAFPYPTTAPVYRGFYIELLFQNRDQNAIDRCCCHPQNTHSSLGFIQYVKPLADTFWGIDDGHTLIPYHPPTPAPHWYEADESLIDFPGSSESSVPPPTLNFRSELHCRTCTNGQDQNSPDSYKKIGEVLWNTQWHETDPHGAAIFVDPSSQTPIVSN